MFPIGTTTIVLVVPVVHLQSVAVGLVIPSGHTTSSPETAEDEGASLPESGFRARIRSRKRRRGRRLVLQFQNFPPSEGSAPQGEAQTN